MTGILTKGENIQTHREEGHVVIKAGDWSNALTRLGKPWTVVDHQNTGRANDSQSLRCKHGPTETLVLDVWPLELGE